MEKQGTGEAALAKKLAEKSKEFDDLTAKLGSMQSSSQGVMENRIREEANKIQQEHFKLHVQAEHAQAEIARLGGMIEEREVVIKSQKRTIDDLEELMVRIRDEYAPDSSYILRTESDLMMDALQRFMLSELESQKKAQAESFVAELSVKLRHFHCDWERRFESASEAWAEDKSLLMSRLEVAQAAQKRLEHRVEQLEAIIQNWAGEEDDNWWAADKEQSEAEALGGSRSGNRMCDPASSGAIHHELDRDDGYSYVELMLPVTLLLWQQQWHPRPP